MSWLKKITISIEHKCFISHHINTTDSDVVNSLSCLTLSSKDAETAVFFLNQSFSFYTVPISEFDQKLSPTYDEAFSTFKRLLQKLLKL